MDKVVLITGGTSGIGLALAEAFMEAGDRVAACARSPAALTRFSRLYPGALAFRADVAVAAERSGLLDAMNNRFARLDVLINNDGTFIERKFLHEDDANDGLEQELALNLAAPIQLTGEVLKRWPSISSLVFVSSGFALVSPTRAPTYGAAKAGIHAFAESLRRQLAPTGIHVLELLPQTTDAQMNAEITGKKMSAADVEEVTLAALAQRRPMALPGDTRLLPPLLRLAPSTLEHGRKTLNGLFAVDHVPLLRVEKSRQ